jgi:MFS family permease
MCILGPGARDASGGHSEDTMSATAPALPRRSLNARTYLSISAYAFALSYLWNSLGPLVIPQLVERTAPTNLVGTALGVVRFVGLLAAVIVQPVAGAWSDRAPVHPRLGKRKPFMLAGTLGDFVFLAALLLAPNFPLLVLAYLGLQIVSNIAHGAYQGFIPDLVPEDKHGAASGAKNLMEMLALIGASLVIARLFGEGEWTAAFLSIGLVLAVSLAVTFMGVREGSGVAASAPPAGGRFDWRAIFTLEPVRDRRFSWWLASRFCMLLGVYFLQTYAFLFVRQKLPNVEPNSVVGPLLALIGILVAVSVGPAGVIADRVGYLRMTLIAGALTALGVFLMLFVSGAVLFMVGPLAVRDVLLFGMPVGIGLGIFLVANWALGMGLAPSDQGGKYLGLSNLATAGAGLAASLGGPVVDWFGFTPLFVVGTASILLGMGLLAKVKDR